MTSPETQLLQVHFVWFFSLHSRWSTKPLAPSKRLMEHLSALPRRKNAPSETKVFNQSVYPPQVLWFYRPSTSIHCLSLQPTASACKTKKPPLQVIAIEYYHGVRFLPPTSRAFDTPHVEERPDFACFLQLSLLWKYLPYNKGELLWTTEVILHSTRSFCFWNWCHLKTICFWWGTRRVSF